MRIFAFLDFGEIGIEIWIENWTGNQTIVLAIRFLTSIEREKWIIEFSILFWKPITQQIINIDDGLVFKCRSSFHNQYQMNTITYHLQASDLFGWKCNFAGLVRNSKSVKHNTKAELVYLDRTLQHANIKSVGYMRIICSTNLYCCFAFQVSNKVFLLWVFFMLKIGWLEWMNVINQ